MLDFNNINCQPMNNVYGTVVTMMDTRHVKHVMIAGKLVYWEASWLDGMSTRLSGSREVA